MSKPMASNPVPSGHAERWRIMLPGTQENPTERPWAEQGEFEDANAALDAMKAGAKSGSLPHGSYLMGYLVAVEPEAEPEADGEGFAESEG